MVANWQLAKVRYCEKGKCDVNISYNTVGDKTHPCIVLLAGLGGQGLCWPDEIAKTIADQGFLVVRLDNRDVGLSTKFEHMPCSAAWKLAAPLLPRRPAPYELVDMAADTVGLLEYLGVKQAHWGGTSMGGMICQVAAIKFPASVLSIISVASTTGNKSLPEMPLSLKLLMIRAPKTNREEDLIEHRKESYMKILFLGSNAPESYAEEFSALQVKRSPYREGNVRQMYAAATTPCRDEALNKLTIPALVMHGAYDELIHPAHGYHTAAMLPNSHFELIRNMSHTLWPECYGTVANGIASFVKRVHPAESSS